MMVMAVDVSHDDELNAEAVSPALARNCQITMI